MVTVILERVYLPTETLGSMYLMNEDGSLGEMLCKTMELPWKKNKRGISCIAEDTYTVIKQPPKLTRPYPYFRIPNVPGRSGILIHLITYVKDLLGCIGVGGAFKDLNKDGVPDIVDSRKALDHLMAVLPETFLLVIRKKL